MNEGNAKSVADQPKRQIFMDVAKCLATFLVVFGHLYSAKSPERLWIYSFHMPFFFMVSGYFHKYNGEIQIKKYFRNLFVPAVFFLLLYDFIFLLPFHWGWVSWSKQCSPGETLVETISHVVHRKWVVFSSISGNMVCWFLFALFWCRVLSDLFTKNKYWGISAIFCVLAISYFMHDPLLMMAQAVVAFPFYWGGHKYGRRVVNMMNWRWMPIIVVLFLLCVLVMVPLNGKVSMYKIGFGKLPMPLNVICFYMIATMACFIFIYFSKFVRFGRTFFEKLSMCLVTVVGMQQIFVKIYYETIGPNANFIISTITSIVIISICYLSHNIIIKYFPFILGKTNKQQ